MSDRIENFLRSVDEDSCREGYNLWTIPRDKWDSPFKALSETDIDPELLAHDIVDEPALKKRLNNYRTRANKSFQNLSAKTASY